MFKIYFINLRWYDRKTFNSIQDAIKHGISAGFDFSVEIGNEVVCSWNPINGTKWYTGEVF